MTFSPLTHTLSLSLRLSVSLSLCLAVSLSRCLSVSLSVSLSLCLSVSLLSFTCDEALTPDARSAECTALYVPLQAEGAFDEAVWLERNASGHVDASRIGHGGRGATVRPRQEIPRSSEEILEI